MKQSKRYQAVAKLVDQKKVYPVGEALNLAKQTSRTKFDGTIEVHIRLGIDPKLGEQQVRGAVTLPAGTGKTKVIAAFVPDGKEQEAKDAGADIVGGTDLIDKIKQTGSVNFEVAVAMPAMMPKLAAIARILGPKGLMPSPKNDTIATDLKKTITELKAGKINFKNDDTGNLHQILGKASFPVEKLESNFRTLLEAVRKAKPAGAKGTYLRSVTINSTMGPSIRIDVTA
ncbi:MAG: 50S ribosomal protein L1 [Patescibacteria group bacterium]|nr:50S ribosomal protein L1 [Patescibacteria group bacterium]